MKRRIVRSTSVLAVVVLVASFALAVRPAAAQETSLTVDLSANTAKAKIGTIVEFRVLVENTGTTTIPALSVGLGLPDALNARAVYCPSSADQVGSVTDCNLGDLGPGSIAEFLFYVEVGSKETNGPVTASVFSDGTVIATDQLAPIKVVGKPNR